MAKAPEDKAKDTGLITRWWWVRHAPVPNPEGRCYGQFDKDCDVSNEGAVQAPGEAAGRGRGMVFVEPAARARKTAEHLGKAGARFGEVVIDPDLAEQSFGEWQGLTYGEITGEARQRSSLLAGAAGVPPPGGESFGDSARSHGAVDRAADARSIAAATSWRWRTAARSARRWRMPSTCIPRLQVRIRDRQCVSVTLIEHYEKADPAHAWRVIFTNYMPREIAHAHGGGSKA